MQNYWATIFNVNGKSLPGPLIIGTFEKRAPGPYSKLKTIEWHNGAYIDLVYRASPALPSPGRLRNNI